MNVIVYVVCSGEDCEGHSPEAVFDAKEKAIKYIEEWFSYFKRNDEDDEWRYGCYTAFIMEFDVR